MNIFVGMKVTFTDEFGQRRRGTVLRIVPRGEYSSSELSVAIQADTPPNYGGYVRTFSEVGAAE